MTEFLYALADIFSILYTLFFFLFLKSFLRLRGNFACKLIGFIALHYICNTIIYPNDLANLLGTLLGISAYILLCYKGQWVEKLSVVLVFYPAVIAVNYLMENIGLKLFYGITQIPGDIDYSTDAHLQMISAGVLCGVTLVRMLFWLSAWLFSGKFLARMTEGLTARMWAVVDMVVLTSFVAVFTVIYFLPSGTAFLMAYPVCLAAIINSFGCMYLASYICQSMRTTLRAQELERQYEYYEEKLKDEERVRRIYHDMRNHLLILQEQSGAAQSVQKAMENLQQQMEGYENYYSTGNRFLDIILRDKSRIAQEKKIDFMAAADFSEGAFLEPLDISTIFGNGLDNAIEACEKLPEEVRYITVKAGRIHDMLTVRIENSAAAGAGVMVKTSKEDPFLHGFGISNIKAAVEKYEGQCSFRLEEDIFTMKLIFPLPY